MKIILTILSSILFLNVFGQELITGSYSFQTDTEKKYAYYIPSKYDGSKEVKLIVGLHPLNTARWDAESWCNELSEIAEANNTIVVCPDGGPDGKIDDPIDTAFTSFMIEKALEDYKIATDSLYAIGFSWGGKTVYTYGLNHPGVFAGFMPIGAAVTFNEVSPFSANMKAQNYYVIHGSNDSPVVRLNPLIDLMEENEACFEINVLHGVGHTVDFDNQFEILNSGFKWLLNHACTVTSVSDVINDQSSDFLKQTSYSVGEDLLFRDVRKSAVVIYNVNGEIANWSSSTDGLSAGVYIVSLIKEGRSQRILVR